MKTGKRWLALLLALVLALAPAFSSPRAFADETRSAAVEETAYEAETPEEADRTEQEAEPTQSPEGSPAPETAQPDGGQKETPSEVPEQAPEAPASGESSAQPEEPEEPESTVPAETAEPSSEKGPSAAAPDAPSAAPSEGADAAEEPGFEEDEMAPVATLSEQRGLRAVRVSGQAALDRREAEQAAAQMTDLSEAEAREAADLLFAETPEPEEPEVPRAGDGSTIETLTVSWITEDTVENDDDALLYVRPEGDDPFNVRLLINYALSGEHPYEAGDVTITIPASIFRRRDGKDAGNVIIPFPEDPSTKNDFNWKMVGDTYVLTNTRRLPAATKGYIQIGFDRLVPHELVDMAVSEPFDAYIEVVTHKGNTIALRSEQLTAQFDTEARLTDISKRVYGKPERVPASSIPEAQRIEGEEEYIRVDWYIWGAVNANTVYTLSLKDLIPEADQELNGFVINANQEDGSLVRPSAYHGFNDGITNYYYVSTAYPASQFEPDVVYTFHNTAALTVTEDDPAAETVNPNVSAEDPRLVTQKTVDAQVSWSYTDPQWMDPAGHFMVVKNGNDDTARGNRTRHRIYSYERSDSHLWSAGVSNGWYGVYPSAFNEIREGKDVRLSYTIDTVGYVMPFMFDSSSFDRDGEVASRRSVNYSRPVRLVTEDSGLSIGRDTDRLVWGKDYEFVSVEFREPWVYTGIPKNINPDGSWTALTAGDGTFEYKMDSDKSHFPVITLEILRGGAWETYAAADWTGGSLKVTLADGSVQTDPVVAVPSDTENVRTVVVMKNEGPDVEANLAYQAAIDYDIRPVVKLLNTEALRQLGEELFANSNLPEAYVYNYANMTATQDDTDALLVSIDKSGYDCIRGYTTDTAVYPKKTSKQTISDVDYETRQIRIHYEAQVEERSVINDKVTYETAIADGRLIAETAGVWRDLLPKGVTPIKDSIEVREGDQVLAVNTYENYKQSGRTLLEVEVALTPVPERYRQGDMYYYEDVPRISFDALYGLDDLTDYGDYIHNVISFESSNDFIGTVDKYCGEPDDPRGTGNISTPRAFSSDKEKDLMTDLDPDRDDPNTVYAGTYTKVDVISEAKLSLSKDVMVNSDGLWSDGLYYGRKEDNERLVREGGVYTYRLRMMPDSETKAKDMIIFDSLENFIAGDGNDDVDIDAPSWHGALRSVDVSQLAAKGCAPVVYYSTVPGLALSDETDPAKANAVNTDLAQTSVWTKASEYTGSLADVTAVAVDCSKAADGSDFTLEPLDSVVILIHMTAPSGEAAAALLAQQGAWGDSANAYNNAFLHGTTVDAKTGEEQGESFVRKDYTKVGLTSNDYQVTKTWDDDSDRDGLRPASLTVRLYANGKDTGKTIELTEENGWKEAFEHIPYTDENGSVIRYSVREELPEGYTQSVKAGENETAFTNRHQPEETQISGTKTWIGDTPEDRPESVTVRLLADGKYQASKEIRPDDKGNWSYSFEHLKKYRDHGVEIVYTVEEVLTGKGKSYIPSVDGTDLINTYHPYGDLMVRKEVRGTTEVSAQEEFEFTFLFTKKGENGEAEPVFTEYAYEVLNEDGTVASEGTVSSEAGKDTVRIRGGQRIHVKDVDEYVICTVTEADKDGFTLVTSETPGNEIRPNETASSLFVNDYQAKGKINLEAQKILEGRELQRFQFRYELYQVDENGEEHVIRTGANARPDQTVTGDDGSVTSQAPITFGALRYTQEDHGKTYTYYIREVDSAKPGITYDTGVIQVDVTVTDNGDGTMTVTPVYSRDGQPLEEPVFTNSYRAEGDLVLRAWKDLTGRPLKDGEFTFELTDEEGKVLQTAANDERGVVTFQPIHFDQTSAGKEFIYGIREVRGEDPTVFYDSSLYGYSVKVMDNGDGTLSFVQGQLEPEYEYETCETCHGEKYLQEKAVRLVNGMQCMPASVPVEQEDGTVVYYLVPPAQGPFQTLLEKGEREYGIGKLAISFGGQIDAPVLLNVTWAGADPQLESMWRSFAQQEGAVVDREGNEADLELPENGQAIYGLQFGGGFSHGALVTFYVPTCVPGCPECGAEGVVPHLVGWKESEELPVFENTLRPGGLSVTKIVKDTSENPGQEFRFRVKLIGPDLPEEMSYMLQPYYPPYDSDAPSSGSGSGSDSSSPTEDPAEFIAPEDQLKGTAYAAVSNGKLTFFRSEETYENGAAGVFTDLTGAQLTGTVYTGFENAGAYASAEQVPWHEAAPQITSVSVAAGQAVRPMHTDRWFAGMTALTSVDLARLDGSQILTAAGMFDGCTSLTELSLDGFKAGRATDVSRLFAGCAALEELWIRTLSTGRATDMTGMFDGCANLKKIVTGYGFSFYGNGIRDNAKKPLWPTPPANDEYTGLWRPEADERSAYAPEQLMSSYGSYMKGVWIWEPIPTQYRIRFYGYQSEYLEGSVPDMVVRADEDAVMPENRFYKFGYTFDHWEVSYVYDENNYGTAGTDTYQPGDVIPAGTYKPKYLVDVHPVMVPVDTKVQVEDGEFLLTLYGNETAYFTNLPAGTVYQIFEETPKGWILVEEKDTNGTIVSNVSAEASVTNEYAPERASVQLVGTKLLDGLAAEEGLFEFELSENGKVLQTVKNLEGGFIRFALITYDETQIGTHTYTITEKAPSASGYDYDTHKETVTVEVARTPEGVLFAEATYDDDGIRFRNQTRPGTLRIRKEARPYGLTEPAASDEFTFKITLENRLGRPLGEDEDIYWYVIDRSGRIRQPGTDGTNNGANLPALRTAFAAAFSAADPAVPERAGEDSSGKGAAEADAAVPAAAAGPSDAKAEPAQSTAPILWAPSGSGLLGASATGPQNPDRIFHATPEMLKGHAYAAVSNNTLVFFRSEENYTVGTRGTFTDIAGNTLTGTLAGKDFENSSFGRHSGSARYSTVISSPWFAYKGSITSLRVAEGCAIKPSNMYLWFCRLNYLKTADLKGFDTSLVKNFEGMFEFDDYRNEEKSALIEVRNLDTLDTSAATNMADIFRYNRQLKEIDVSNFDTHNVTSFRYAFEGCSQLSTLDTSGFDTSSATQLTNMFAGCSQLSKLDVSSFDTSSATDMSKMFDETRNLKELDLSNFDTSACTNMQGMLSTCGAVRYKLGENFDFFGNEITETKKAAVFQTLSSSELYTGKWICEERPEESGFTSAELRDTYTPDMAGTWVLEMRSDRGVIRFDCNGGYPAVTDYIFRKDNPTVMMKTTTSSSFYQPSDSTLAIVYWTEDPEGNGTRYLPSQSYDFSEYLGKTTTLYAQWGIVYPYKVIHYRENLSGSTPYSVYRTENLKAEKDTEVTPDVLTIRGYNSPEPQTVRIDAENIVIEYYYTCQAYTVNLDGNGATSGMMDSFRIAMDSYAWLKPNTYQRKGWLFTGWNTKPDGSGRTYSDKGLVRDLTTKDGDTVTLYAQWLQNETEVHPEKGVIYVTCRANETIMIPGLPAGTTYTVEEVDIPVAWRKISESGTSGTIVSDQTANVTFENKYEAQGHTYLQVWKIMEGRPLEDGEFTFNLYDWNNNLVEQATNDADGNVVFGPIDFDQEQIGRSIYYRIAEADTGDTSVTYDPHYCSVYVYPYDVGGGILDARVTYAYGSNSQRYFHNRAASGTLEILKTVVTDEPGTEDTSFDFLIRLYDVNGEEITDMGYAGWRLTSDPYDYGTSVTVRSGSTLTLKGGERILIDSLSDGMSYEITEIPKKDWKQTSVENAKGVIHGKTTVRASFENTYEWEPYSADGTVKLTAYKTVSGGTIREEDEFVFELLNEAGDVIQRKLPDTFGEETSAITFDPISFDQDDMDGATEKVFRFFVREVPGTDPEVIYDAGYEKVFEVTVRDDGEGHLLTHIGYGSSAEDPAGEDGPGSDGAGNDGTGNDGTGSGSEGTEPAGTETEGGTPEDSKTADEIRFTNVKRAELKVVKKDAVTEEVLAGACFTIAQGEKYVNDKGELTDEAYEFVTDDEGLLKVRYLSAGEYVLHETKAPTGYLPAEEDVTFTVYDSEILVEQEPVEEITVLDEPYYGDLEITKIVERFDETGGPATFVFNVTAVLDGKTVFEDVVALTFTEAGTRTAKIVGRIPAGATVTVTEIYSGAGYVVTSQKSVTGTISPTEPVKATFVNRYDDELVHGSGILNEFTSDGNGGWTVENGRDSAAPGEAPAPAPEAAGPAQEEAPAPEAGTKR